MRETLIRLERVTKTFRDSRYRKIESLKGVSLSVAEGEAFGFVGPNGAGKSTTIKILTGVLKPTSGEAYLLGRPVEDHASRRGLGYVPENPYLYDYLTPMEVLMMGVKLHGLQLGDAKGHCQQWLERFGIENVANKPIRTFSKGMTQRTALAHALACKPRLLILDEPLSGLDPIGRKEVVDILMEYKQQGGSLFFSSHVLHDVERLADRFGLIHKGELCTIRTPAEILSADAEMIIRYRGEQAVAGAVVESPGVLIVTVGREHVWDVLRQIEAAGMALVEVRSTATLERAFMEFVKAA